MRARPAAYTGVEMPPLPAWHEEAACRGSDPESFFPTRTGATSANIAAVKRICGSCLHQWTCLGWAIGSNHSDGILGGATPAERKAMVDAMNETKALVETAKTGRKPRSSR